MEEKKSVRYDAKKLALEVFSKWKALIVITLLVAVVFCVISITGTSEITYEAKEGFIITYPELTYTPAEGTSGEEIGEILNIMLAEQRRKVARAVDTLKNTAYINLFNELKGTDGKYKMDKLKEDVLLELTNDNTTLTVTVKAGSAKDAVLMLDSLEKQVKAAIGNGETKDFTVQLSYKNGEEDLDAMYTAEEGGVMSVIISVVEGVVIGFVAAVVLLLIWSAVFMRVTYPEDISSQTEYTVLATVYAGENNLGEAVIKSAMLRGEKDSTTYVMGMTKSAADIAAAWAEREKQSGNAVFVDFDDESGKGIAGALNGVELDEVIADGKLSAGAGLDIYGRREEIANLLTKVREKYPRMIISGYSGADVRSELLAAFASDTALVVEEGYSIKKLIETEEKYNERGRKIEGVILRKKNARKASK